MEDSTIQSVRAWKVILRDRSFTASERRANAVARFLVQNDFYSLEDLQEAKHPSSWEGASEILDCTL